MSTRKKEKRKVKIDVACLSQARDNNLKFLISYFAMRKIIELPLFIYDQKYIFNRKL